MAEQTSRLSVLDTGAFDRARGLFAAPRTRLAADAVQTLATEVISRLSHRHALPHVEAAPQSEVHVDAELAARIQRLAEALLAVDDDAATDIVMEAHSAGMAPETIYLGLLAESARLLGRWWEEDRVSSLDVVLGAGRVYAIMRGLRRLFRASASRGHAYRALFATTPGETHSIGVAMAADLLGRSGWEIDLRAGLPHDDLVAEARTGGHHIIGLSASAPRMLFPLARVVVALRLASPGVWILVCGRIVELEPEVAHLVDADAAAADLTAATALMEAHLG